MAHLCLVVPFDPDPRDGIGNNSMPPLRLALLAAVCRAAGHRVSLVDGVGEGFGQRWSWGRFRLHGLGFDELLARVPDDADVLGVSLMFSTVYPPTRELVLRARAARPNRRVVLGGEGVTGLADEILAATGADAIVVGEGEGPLLSVLQRWDAGQDADGLRNVVTPTTPYALAVDLDDRTARLDIDALPAPDWSGLPLQPYWTARRVHGVAVGDRFLPLIASRGCPFDCRFCSAPGTWGSQRYPRVATVIDQLRAARDAMGVTYFIFNDLSITTSIRWFGALVDALLAADLGIRWAVPSGVRAQHLGRDLLARARDSGLLFLQISPETGSPAVMAWLDKRLDLESVLRTVVEAKAVGLPVSACLIVGHPVEGWAEYIETLKFLDLLVEYGLDELVINVFTPLPGSPAFDDARAAGLRIDDDWFAELFLNDLGAAVSHTPHFDGPRLRLLRLYAYLWFYGRLFAARPELLTGSMRRAAEGRQSQRLDKVLRYELPVLVRGFAPTLLPTSWRTAAALAVQSLRDGRIFQPHPLADLTERG